MAEEQQIRNIYCIGRNYRMHAIELGNEIPKSPLVFTKPSHAVAAMDGELLPIPGDRGAVHFELEIVLRVGKPLSPGMNADECIDAMTLGLDLTLRDVQSRLKEKGQPWLEAKGFKASAPLGRWLPYPGEEGLKDLSFTLIRNGEQAQLGNSSDMLFPVSKLIEHIDRLYGLGQGDLIYTGTPEGVAALNDGDVLEAFWGKQLVGSNRIKLV
ncbi:fumarylacetoacetate hydrolase family protein [Paenibacillus sp. NEAU-GSW1]|uniref:fumarylacetoacetate hydrolase family protein n=1 Tax=Paenibacillus sp. NEAU-GSW1 TaxID=2682486 RepID=UPI0012E1B762|nr:fumarylacetoacetate hydrolase family protein [Paenibacillus sp. NEAU-GSW1]MUT64555.1 FAA hydrolase family protein [Paenibacillus sp. NEAU-GSW1]